MSPFPLALSIGQLLPRETEKRAPPVIAHSGIIETSTLQSDPDYKTSQAPRGLAANKKTKPAETPSNWPMMIAQRAATTALRRVAGKPSSFFSQNLIRVALTSNMSTTQPRLTAATTKISSADAQQILVEQRRKRPVSPHLAVYDFKQTWFIGSIWQRFTGAGLSGALYLYGIAYLTAPLLGWHLESASLAAAFASLPVAAKMSFKFLAAWPFVFHGLNGVRHLFWDVGYGFTRSRLITEGWAWWGASVLGGLAIVLFI